MMVDWQFAINKIVKFTIIAIIQLNGNYQSKQIHLLLACKCNYINTKEHLLPCVHTREEDYASQSLQSFLLLHLPPFPYSTHSIMINKLFIHSCHFL